MGHTPPQPPEGRKWESDETPFQGYPLCPNCGTDVFKEVSDREELNQIREYLWPNQTGLPNEHRDCLIAIQARDKYVASRIERLEKENEVLMRAASGPAIQLADLHLRNERRLVARIKELEEKAKKDAS